MKVLITTILFALTLMACGGSGASEAAKPDQDPVANLRQEVMDIHDETMKYMTDIKRAKKKLQQPEFIKSKNQEAVLQALTDLKLADSLMMDWMHKYKEPNDPAQLKSYLEGELVSIKKVDAAINHSMAQAKKLLAQ